MSMLLPIMAMMTLTPASVSTPDNEAGTQPVSGSSLRASDLRVASVVHRLATRAKGHCGAVHPLTGLLLHHLGEYREVDRREAAQRYGIDKGPGVLAVVPASPAARAGIKAGDVLLALNGLNFSRPSPHEKPEEQRAAADALLERQALPGPVRFSLLRDGKPVSLELEPETGCAVRGRLARSNQANAFADGRYAVVTTKMLDFIRSDDELAIVMAHEMAHNLLGHPARLDEQKVPHGILRNFGKNAARVLETEREADRFAIKLVWAAGYDLSAAMPFWRRLYARYDPIPVPKLFRTHPSLGGRERLIQEVIAELKSKEAGSR